LSRTDAIGAAYLVCAILFIIGLRRLSSPATARSGNQLAAIGMAFAIVATLFDQRVLSYQWIVLGAVIGGVGGAIGARKVKMTAMPQMVALFNGFGGGAAALVALADYHDTVGLPGHVEGKIIASILFSAATLYARRIPSPPAVEPPASSDVSASRIFPFSLPGVDGRTSPAFPA